jgi:hypothetical protein
MVQGGRRIGQAFFPRRRRGFCARSVALLSESYFPPSPNDSPLEYIQRLNEERVVLPMDKASEAIFPVQPVTFRYKKALDPEALPQFGLVAEQVTKVDPDLVARDAEGKPFTVRYEEINAMLLNEFLKEHRKVEDRARRSVS